MRKIGAPAYAKKFGYSDGSKVQVFTCNKNKITTSIKCEIPGFVYDMMMTVSDLFPEYEFSVQFKGKINPETKSLDVDWDDWFIPKQTVTVTSVDDMADSGEYNIIVHKHPEGFKVFSHTDKEWVNQNCMASLLWCDGQFVDGIVNVDTVVGRLQLKVDIVKTFIYNDAVVKMAKENIIPKVFTIPLSNTISKHITIPVPGEANIPSKDDFAEYYLDREFYARNQQIMEEMESFGLTS
jgi:hypothetical protein